MQAPFPTLAFTFALFHLGSNQRLFLTIPLGQSTRKSSDAKRIIRLLPAPHISHKISQCYKQTNSNKCINNHNSKRQTYCADKSHHTFSFLSGNSFCRVLSHSLGCTLSGALTLTVHSVSRLRYPGCVFPICPHHLPAPIFPCSRELTTSHRTAEGLHFRFCFRFRCFRFRCCRFRFRFRLQNSHGWAKTQPLRRDFCTVAVPFSAFNP